VNLREVFTPLFAYVLHITRPSAARTRTAAEIRQNIDELLRTQKNQVQQHVLSQADYDLARFAVFAWIDELVLRFATSTNNQELHYDWQQALLAVAQGFDANAGERFFDQQKNLGSAQKEVREIFYLCLCFGFRGLYKDSSPEKLLDLRRDCTPELPVVPSTAPELELKKEHITPQVYEVPPIQRVVRVTQQWWPKVAAAACAALILAYLLWPTPPPCGNGTVDPGEQCDLALAGQCGVMPCQQNCTCAVPPIPDTPVLPGPGPLVPLGPDMAEIDKILRNLQCAKVTARDDGGVITLEGTLQGKDRQRLVSAVRAVANVQDVRDESLAVLEWPFCKVVELLPPAQAQAAEAGATLGISLQRGCEQIYQAGTQIVVRVTSASPLGYVYVDAYGADRAHVVHVVPNLTNEAGAVYPTSTSLTIGDDSRFEWHVEAPFGQELITVISSQRPLFLAPQRQDSEDVGRYLSDLEQSLRSVPPESVSAAMCFFTTER
jgi:type VI secretion system protein ImpK